MAEGSWIRIGAVAAHLDAGTVNSIIEKVLVKRAISIMKKPELRQSIGEELLKIVTPFVPVSKDKKVEHLWMSGRATDDGRLYWTAINSRGDNYASYVYDEDKLRWDSNYVNPSTDKTYPQWMERVQPDTAEWNAFVNNITPLIKEAFRNE